MTLSSIRIGWRDVLDKAARGNLPNPWMQPCRELVKYPPPILILPDHSK